MASNKLVPITLIVVILVTVLSVLAILQYYSDDAHVSLTQLQSNDSDTHPSDTKHESREQIKSNEGIEQFYTHASPPSVIISTTQISETRHTRQPMVRKYGRYNETRNGVKSVQKKRKRPQRLEISRQSCISRTKYVHKKTAEDVFGDTVDVYPVIIVGSLAIDQYFYESFCDEERCECVGINNKSYSSSCQTTHTYTYARIVKGGEIGWGLIKVRSGCSCEIEEKVSRSAFSIADLMN
jgi:hypothetical protein